MSNMSYCRFHNTLQDLQECYDNMDDVDISPPEKEARKRLILLCQQIASDYENMDLEEDDED